MKQRSTKIVFLSLSFFVVGLLTSPCFGQQATFTSKAAGNWTDATIWNCTGLPGACSTHNYPGQFGYTNDIVNANHVITLNAATPLTAESLTISNATTDARIAIQTGLTITGAVTINGLATSGSIYNATLTADLGSSVSAGSVSITRNQGNADPNSSVSLVVSNNSIFSVAGDITCNYIDTFSPRPSTFEATNEIWVGNGGVGDGAMLLVGGNLNFNYNSQSDANLSLVGQNGSQVQVNGGVNLRLIDGYTNTSIVRIDLQGNASMIVNGDMNLSFEDTTSPNAAENVEVLLGVYGTANATASLSVNNFLMTSNFGASNFNNLLKLRYNSHVTVNGFVSLVNTSNTNENRVELNETSTFTIYGVFKNTLKGSFEFLNNSTIELLGSSAQNLPFLKGSTSFRNIKIDNSGNSNITLSGSSSSSPAAPTTTIAGTLNLVHGKLISSTTNYFQFADGATSNIGTTTGYITGPVKKLGTSSITLPLGSGSYWAPIELNSIQNLTALTVEYKPSAYPGGSTPAAPGGFSVSSHEYWDLSATGTSPRAQVSLHWKDACFSHITDATSVAVGNFVSGSGWVSNLSTSSATSGGGICPNGGTSPSTYSGVATSNANTVPLTAPLTFVSTGNALPVELASFTANIVDEEHIKLDWITQSEYNNDYFTILRSSDGKTFHELATLEGAGTSHQIKAYSYVDISPLSGHNYYQLRQVDFDGREHMSSVVSKKITTSTNQFSIYPNPVENGSHVTITSNLDRPFTIERIQTLQGVDVSDNISIELTDTNAIRLSLNPLPKGMYLVVIRSSSGLATARFSSR